MYLVYLQHMINTKHNYLRLFCWDIILNSNNKKKKGNTNIFFWMPCFRFYKISVLLKILWKNFNFTPYSCFHERPESNKDKYYFEVFLLNFTEKINIYKSTTVFFKRFCGGTSNSVINHKSTSLQGLFRNCRIYFQIDI